MSDQKPTSYRPSAYYFRRELRNSKTKAQAVAVGLHVVRELEYLKEWIRDQGLVPPRRFITKAEISDKDLSRFSSSSSAAPQPEAE